MLDATTSGMTDKVEAQEAGDKLARAGKVRTRKAARKPAKTAAKSAKPRQTAASVPSPAVSMETPAVMAATGFMAPFAMAEEATMFWRRARCLSVNWMEALGRCRTPQDLIDTNAHFGEKALTLGYDEGFRVLERGALMGRQAAAPGSLVLRDSE